MRILTIARLAVFAAVVASSVAQPSAPAPASKPAAAKKPAAALPAPLPAQAGKWTQADLLRRIIDLDRLTVPPTPDENTGMFSSFDRAATIDAAGKRGNWYANEDRGQFLKDAADGWKVMAEIEGAGAITRMWADQPSGDLRVVVDGKTVIDGPFADLFRGLVPPIAAPLVDFDEHAGGANCYFPLGFGKRCEILAKNCNSAYQINYVTFGKSATVEPFEKSLSAEAQTALDAVSETMARGYSQRYLFAGRKLSNSTEGPTRLSPKEKMTASFGGAGTVRAIYVRVSPFAASRDPRGLHRCVLRMFFDGRKEPDVEAPLPDFFGSGFGRVEFEALPVSTHTLLDVPFADENSPKAWESVFMHCYFPMPYQNGATLEIENMGEGPVELMLIVKAEKTPPAANALRFHARYKRDDPAPADFPVLDTSGVGRFVGLVLNVDTPNQTPWTDGDETVFIAKRPAYRGTGSADLLGSAEPIHPGVGPFRGVTRTGPFGKSSGYRWFLPDAIVFRDGLRFELATPSARNQKDTFYGTIAYWYGDAGASWKFDRLTAAHVTPPGLRLPGSVEVEGNVLTDGASSEIKQKHAGLELSGGEAASITSADWVDVRIPWKTSGKFWLRVRVNPREPFQSIEMEDAKQNKIGTATWSKEAGGYYDLGWVELVAGDNKFRIKCAGKPHLDCWILDVKQPAASTPAKAEEKAVSGD